MFTNKKRGNIFMKKIMILVFIIIILATILCFKVFLSNSENNSFEPSKEDILDLINNESTKYSYTCKYYEFGSFRISKYKDDIFISHNTFDDATFEIVYHNYNSYEEIIISSKSNNAIIHDSRLSSTPLLYASYIYSMLIEEDTTYKYLRKDTYNGYDCIVTLWNNYNKNYELWFDSATGFLIKQIKTDDSETKIVEYTITLNDVTYEEVQRPDLTGYTIRDMKHNS